MAKITLKAKKLKQHAHELYVFTMNSKELKNICYVTPRSENNPDEIQRLLNPKRAKEIGEYIQNEISLLPNSIVISLKPEVAIIETDTENEVIIQFPSDDGKFSYILDGQHRLAGFNHSNGVEFDLPVVALYNANETQRGKIFADINSKQVKVSDVHLLELYYQIKELPSEESATMSIVHKLNMDTDSPLYNKIKIRDDEQNKWFTNKHIKQRIAPHTESGGVLSGKTTANQVQILKEYLKGVKKMWPNAWGDNQKYNLTKAMGIEIMLGIFPTVKHRCDLNEGRQYLCETFQRQLEPLNNCQIEIPGGGKINLTWERGPFGPLANKTGRSLITKNLITVLNLADEQENF